MRPESAEAAVETGPRVRGRWTGLELWRQVGFPGLGGDGKKRFREGALGPLVAKVREMGQNREGNGEGGGQ